MTLNNDTYLTKNFRRGEFFKSATATRKNINNTPPFEVMLNIAQMARWLQKLRDCLCDKYQRDVVITIKSGYRSPALNKAVGGAKNSAHLLGLAADITAIGITPYQLTCDIIDNMEDWDQVILEFDDWVHVGLCLEPKDNRKQVLEAVKRGNSFGKLVTRYLPFNRRAIEYNFG